MHRIINIILVIQGRIIYITLVIQGRMIDIILVQRVSMQEMIGIAICNIYTMSETNITIY